MENIDGEDDAGSNQEWWNIFGIPPEMKTTKNQEIEANDRRTQINIPHI